MTGRRLQLLQTIQGAGNSNKNIVTLQKNNYRQIKAGMASKQLTLTQQACLCLVLVLGITYSQFSHAVTGSQPPFLTVEPDLDVYPQNFAVIQDRSSRIFIGNTEGVIDFDGEHWNLTGVSNGDIVRSLAYDGADRIYVGGYDAFGYIEANNRGEYLYTDLSEKFADQLQGELFADIWDVVVTDEGVFFRALKHVFFWQPDTGDTSLWQWPGRFGAIEHYDGETILQFRGEGFRVLRDGVWQPLPATSELKELIVDLVPLPDGGLLTVSRNGDWLRITQDTVAPYPMPAAIPLSSKFSSGVLLEDGSLALCDDLGAIYLYNPETGQLQQVSVSNSYLSGITKGVDGNVIALSDSGFHNISWPAKWNLLDKRNGLVGSIFSIKQIDTYLYAMSGSGVFRKSINDTQFERLPWTEHEAWDLLALENDEMMFADSYGLHLVSGDEVTSISDKTFYPRTLKRSRHNPNLIYAGTELGIALIEKIDNQWQLVYHNDDMRNLRITNILETTDNSILISSEREGVMALSFLKDDGWQLASTSFDETAGITYGDTMESSIVQTRSGDIFASTEAGFFKFGDTGFTKNPLAGLQSLRPANKILYLAESPTGALWGFTHNRLYHQLSDQSWIEENVSAMRNGGINSISFDANDRVLVGANGSIMIYDALRAKPTKAHSKVNLTKVQVRDANNRYQNVSLKGDLALEQGNWLIFDYALMDLRSPGLVRYQARLDPVESEFSDWSESSRRSYFGLEPGEYEFFVNARSGNGELSTASGYTLTVRPYWYQHPIAIIAFVFSGLVLIGILNVAITKRRSRKLALENERLERMVAERTRELESANRQLDTMAHLDGLTEIPNRRRLDSYLEDLWLQCTERDRVMAVAILDVDHFKQFNDTHGHVAGDELLKELAGLLSHSLRRSEDLVARYGGEEFLIVLPGADPDSAMVVAEAMRKNVEQSRLAITISGGVASTHGQKFASIEALIKGADSALYKAKNTGRNRIQLVDTAILNGDSNQA